MSTIVQTRTKGALMNKVAEVLVKAAQTIQNALSDHPFFDWRWAVADVVVIGIWVLH